MSGQSSVDLGVADRPLRVFQRERKQSATALPQIT
jgi:hypothetical protein